MDAVSLGIIVGLAGLIVERIFVYCKKIKNSTCCGMKIERDVSD